MLRAGMQAPAFTLPDMDGQPRPLQDFLKRGPVLLSFFKISCPTCQYTFPFLQRLSEKLDGSLLTVAGISQDARKGTAEYNRQLGVRFPVLLEGTDDYAVSNAYGIDHVPSLFLIEPEGRISLASEGFVRSDLEEIARRMGAAPLFLRGEKIEAFRPG